MILQQPSGVLIGENQPVIPVEQKQRLTQILQNGLSRLTQQPRILGLKCIPEYRITHNAVKENRIIDMIAGHLQQICGIDRDHQQRTENEPVVVVPIHPRNTHCPHDHRQKSRSQHQITEQQMEIIEHMGNKQPPGNSRFRHDRLIGNRDSRQRVGQQNGGIHQNPENKKTLYQPPDTCDMKVRTFICPR